MKQRRQRHARALAPVLLVPAVAALLALASYPCICALEGVAAAASIPVHSGRVADGVVEPVNTEKLTSRVYLDRSRARARRWCSMQLCGSSAKMKSYGRSQKTTSSPRAVDSG